MVEYVRRLVAVLAGLACMVLSLVAIYSTDTHDLATWGVFSAGVGILALIDPVEVVSQHGAHGSSS